MCDVEEGFLLIIAAKRIAAGEQGIGKHADRPNVGLERERLILYELWSNVIGCALNLAHILRAFDGARESKIAELQSIVKIVGVEQNVLWFDVEVSDVSAV